MFVAFMEEQEDQLKCKKHNIVPCGINLNNKLPPSERIICSICLGFNQDKLIPNNGFQKCLKNIQIRQMEKMKFLQQNFPELILIEHLYNLNENLQKDCKIKEARNEFKQKLCKYSFFEELKNYPNQQQLITELEKDNTQNNVKLIWSKYNPIDFWIKSNISNMSKLNVSFNINIKEIQVYDEKFIRIEKDPLVLVLQNYEQFLYLKWVGQYNARLLKVGK